MRRKPNLSRRESGVSTYEFGPAMFVLLIFFFFPLIDLLSICVSYGLCMVLNYNQLHEASVEKASDAQDTTGSVKKAIPDQWLNGMGHFVKIVGYPKTVVSYAPTSSPSPPASWPGGVEPVSDQTVTVTTTVVCSPFLAIPLFVINVPGLNGPMTFAVTSSHLMENPDYAQE
jgi:hypothetical protein